MFSGKTEELLRRLRRAKLARLNVEIFKPCLDNRFSDEDIVCHDANSIRATRVDNSGNILLLSGDIDVVGIDEAQFFDLGLVEICNKLADRSIRVIVAGLDMDYRGVPFGPVPSLMATAEYVTKVNAICVGCGDLANYTHRLSGGGNLIELGASESYQALCRSCYNKARGVM
jgi:thymidine kinase